MKTEQINIRLDADLISALERVAREEALDRATAIRRLLGNSIRQWELERAIAAYRTKELSLGRAAEEAGLTQWELSDAIRAAGIAYPLGAEEARERLGQLSNTQGSREPPETLPDVPPRVGGVLLVGINPAPISVAAGHYYQGRLGQRLWRRLERLGLLIDGVPGAEDQAFEAAGHGLTDLVKRPTRSSSELSDHELGSGVEELRAKVRQWKPGLLLFAFMKPARILLGPDVAPGRGPAFEGVQTFVLTGPYAPRSESVRIDDELRGLAQSILKKEKPEPERTQRVTASDLERGQIRFPQSAKRFFPSRKGLIEVVIRGTRLTVGYDPRLGPDRERSAVLHADRSTLSALVRENERLSISRGMGGVVVLD